MTFKSVAIVTLLLAVFMAVLTISSLGSSAIIDKPCKCFGLTTVTGCLGLKTSCSAEPTNSDDPTINPTSATQTACLKKVNGSTYTIDFSKCSACSQKVDVALGSTTLELDPLIDGNSCVLRYGGEVENPNWNGVLDRECRVPLSQGVVTLKSGNYGIDFSPISSFCRQLAF